jgi:hypothetical protein
VAEPPSALNGRVLDPSAVASWTEGRLAVQSWLGVAGKLGLTMIVPELAVEEIAKLRPEADGVLWRLKRHPQVLLAHMDATRKAAIEAIHEHQPLADVTAAWVVTIARERGWTVLSADPRRLRVLDPHLPIDMV